VGVKLRGLKRLATEMEGGTYVSRNIIILLLNLEKIYRKVDRRLGRRFVQDMFGPKL